MNLVELHRDPIVAGTHVYALPPWLPPSGHPLATYWHIPRSASLTGDGRLHIHLWCGQLRVVDAAALAATDIPPLELRCGTCAGRRLGYDRRDGLIFRPRDPWALPATCPSTTPDPDDWDVCFACGRKTNAARGWNAYGLARHAPAPELAERYEPCPRHGWTRMYMRSDPLELVCFVFRCDYRAARIV